MADQTAKVLCKVGDSKPKGVKSKIKNDTAIQIIQDVNGQRTVIGTGRVKIDGPPPVNIPPKVSAGEDARFDVGTKHILLDGSASDEDGRIVRAQWRLLQPPQLAIQGMEIDPNDFTNLFFDAPDLPAGQKSLALLWEFEAEDDAAVITKDSCIITIGEKITPPPPPSGVDLPEDLHGVEWYYKSDEVLSHPGKYPTKKRSPYDPVLLFSNASSVDYHTIISDPEHNYLDINTGAQYGRTYWELYELEQFATTGLGKESTCMAGFFRLHSLANDCDFSIKLGDHGTEGYKFDGKKFVGGAGLSFHAGEVQSKFEWRHGKGEGKETSHKYKDGKKLEAKVWYPFAVSWAGDEKTNTITLHVYIKFGDVWQHVVDGKKWEKDDEWVNHGIGTVPTDALDYEACVKGPGFLKFDHIWTRANQGDVDVYGIMFGSVPAA